MNRAKKPRPAARGYHHGNLRQALLDAALALVASGEAQELSLRTAAARAGVSSAAPYRHFQDREALLAAVATIGFERLLEALVAARPTKKAGSRLLAMAWTYLTFAARNRGLYRLMFAENHLAIRFDEALAQSSRAAFLELQNAVAAHLTDNASAIGASAIEVSAIKASGSQSTQDGAGAVKLIATTIWATLHGATMLAFERLISAGEPSDETQAWEISAAIARLLIERLFVPSGAQSC